MSADRDSCERCSECQRGQACTAYADRPGPVGPDGFTRLAGYVAECVNVSPAALRAQVTEAQHNALEMARKAALAERRAEEAEYHVEQLRDARDRAERRIEAVEALADKLGATPDWNMTHRNVAQSIRTALAQAGGVG